MTGGPAISDPRGLLERLLDGEAAALAKAITAVENDFASAAGLLAGIQPRLGHALVLGVTGSPGAGKSTLVGALIAELRRRGRTVGVIAVDPSSPLSGGAILGDRIRMTAHGADPGVFVRSLASRGHVGGLSAATARVVDVMDAAGKEVVIIETVGAGQSDVEVAEVADVKIVVCTPDLGDDVQAIKAGILEIADVLVLNKADLPLAERAVNQLRGMITLRAGRAQEVPVLSTIATQGEGVGDLADAVEEFDAGRDPAARAADALARVRRLIAEEVSKQVKERIRSVGGGNLDALCTRVQRGEMDVGAAAREIIEQHFRGGEDGA